jgi:sugar lactone lactonase YvrE
MEQKCLSAGLHGDDVNEYTLSTGFDVSTASFVDAFSISSQENNPSALAFNTDGTKMFIVGLTNDTVYQYSLSTGFDVSTASYDSVSFSVASQDGSPFGLAFNSDGTKMFIVAFNGDAVYEYTLSTGFNVSTASFVDSFSVASQETLPQGLAFNSDGTKMFIVGQTNDTVYQYNLSTGFDVSTATYSQNFDVSAQDTIPRGIAFNTDGTKMFVAGYYNSEIHEYSIGSTAIPSGYHPVHTTASIDSTYWTDINSMTADQAAGDGNVYYAISTDDRTTWTVIDNTDGERDIVRNNAGTWQYNSNGTYASETWVNGATNTELATLAEAMEAEGIANEFDVSTSVYSQAFSIAGQEINPMGVAFSANGTKMFIVGSTGQDVNEYTLSTSFDVSTSSFVDSFSVSAQDSIPRGITFSTDGTKMFVVGSNGDAVYEYTLSPGFDVSTASYVDSFSVSAQETEPRGIAFNADGTKMFIVGQTGDAVNEYSLSTGFSVSTSTFVDAFSISAQESIPTGLTFNTNGTKMFIIGQSGDDVNEYSLTTGFDVSTASYTQAFSVSAQETSPTGLTFNTNGSKMFIVGQQNDTVYEYTVGSTYYINQMDKTQLDAVTDPNHIALGDDLDLAIIFNMTSGTTVPSSDGVAINYDATVLNKGAVLGTDYDFDAPAGDEVRITALTAGNFKVRVV